MKILKYLITLFVVVTFMFTSKSFAYYNSTTASNWDFWYFYPFKSDYSSNLFLTGSSSIVLQSEDKTANLHLGMTSSSESNFNYVINNSILLYGNLYADVSLQNNTKIMIGFNSGTLSKKAIVASRSYSYGVPLLHAYNNKDVNNRVMFDGSYMQYNNAFSISYNKKFFFDTAALNITYIPNIDFNLSSNTSFYRNLKKNLGVAEASINYYNEYNDIGYGLISGFRIYSANVAIAKGGEVLISPNIDFLGFGLSYTFLGGSIKGSPFMFSYQLNEISLDYSVLKFNFSADYGYNSVSDYYYNKIYYNNLTLGIKYLLNSKVSLNGSLFIVKNNVDSKNQGLAFGFTFNL